MSNEVYARIRSTSQYASQDTGEPFVVTLNTNPRQLADGFYIDGGPGGNYSPEDLDFYTEFNGELVLVKRTSRAK